MAASKRLVLASAIVILLVSATPAMGAEYNTSTTVNYTNTESAPTETWQTYIWLPCVGGHAARAVGDVFHETITEIGTNPATRPADHLSITIEVFKHVDGVKGAWLQTWSFGLDLPAGGAQGTSTTGYFSYDMTYGGWNSDVCAPTAFYVLHTTVRISNGATLQFYELK